MNWANLYQRCHRLRHLLVTLALIISLFAAEDFFDRILVPRDESLRRFDTPAISMVVDLATAETILKKVTDWVPEPTIESVVKSREITLQAIFSQGGKTEAFIVLLADGDRLEERVKVAVGSEVDGWRVQSISRTRVMLKKGDEQRVLVVFRGRME